MQISLWNDMQRKFGMTARSWSGSVKRRTETHLCSTPNLPRMHATVNIAT